MKMLSHELEDALYARVLAAAKRQGITRSDLVRDAVLDRLSLQSEESPFRSRLRRRSSRVCFWSS